MEINTKKREPKYFIIAGVLMLFIFVLYYIHSKPPYFYGRTGFQINESYLLEIFIGLFVGLFLLRPSHFEYNDTDQVVIVKGRRILLGRYIFKRDVTLELPKRKIRRVRIQRKFFRDYLSITVNSKRSIKRTRSIDMSLLTKQEKKAVLDSLMDIASHQESEENYGKTVHR